MLVMKNGFDQNVTPADITKVMGEIKALVKGFVDVQPRAVRPGLSQWSDEELRAELERRSKGVGLPRE